MKSLIVYTYYSSPSSNFNLDFFVKNELSYKMDIDYIIVINGHDTPIQFPTIPNLTVLRRDNVGYDFGGHAHALNFAQSKYDYYFFMNSGVFGPVISDDNHWSNTFIKKINEKVKLVGTTIVCLPHTDISGKYGPKVEGFFFMTDSIGLNIISSESTIFCNHPTKHSAIVNGEYGISTCILKHGYSIDCMLPQYQNIDWTDSKNYTLNNNIHPSRKNSFFGKSINPYDVIFHKWFWHNQPTVNFDIIKEYKNRIEKK